MKIPHQDTHRLIWEVQDYNQETRDLNSQIRDLEPEIQSLGLEIPDHNSKIQCMIPIISQILVHHRRHHHQ